MEHRHNKQDMGLVQGEKVLKAKEENRIKSD